MSSFRTTIMNAEVEFTRRPTRFFCLCWDMFHFKHFERRYLIFVSPGFWRTLRQIYK